MPKSNLLPLLFIALLPNLAAAQISEPNPPQDSTIGPVTRLTMALALLREAEASPAPAPLLLAKAAAEASRVQLRAAPNRTAVLAKTKSPASDTQVTPDAALPLGAALAFLQSGEAMGAAVIEAGDDDALLDQIEPLAAMMAWGHSAAASVSEAELPPGHSAEWRLPFPGQSPAEVTLLALGSGNAEWSVKDEAGQEICAPQAITTLFACRFTPEVNSYYSVALTAALPAEAMPLRYMLVTN